MNRVTEANVIEVLKEHQEKIQADADAGQREAKQLISVYGMYYRHPDPPTLGVLMGATDGWLRTTKGTTHDE